MYWTLTLCKQRLKHSNNSQIDIKDISISQVKYLKLKEINQFSLNYLQKNEHSISI